MNATDPIRQHARSTPDAPAYILDDRPTLSYRDFDAVLEGIAQRLLDAGVHPGQRVALALHRDFAFVAVALAAARIGAIGFTAYSPDEACDFRIASRGAAPSTLAPTIAVDKQWFLPPDGGARGAPVAMHPGGSVLFHIFHTSGTTGRPKALAMSHDDILRRAERRRSAFAVPHPVRMLAKVRPVASYGFQVMLRVLFDGGAVVDAPALEGMAGAITRHRVTFLVAPPGILSGMIAVMRPDEGPFPTLHVVEVSGSRLSEQLAEVAAQRVCPNIVTMYGSTEAGLIAVASAREAGHIPGAVGRIIPGVVAEIVDDSGTPLPPDTEGALRLRADSAQTYLDDSGPTDAFRDGWFYSGDIGRITRDGFLVIAGRADERINVGGGKVTPEFLEHAALAIPGVIDAAAFAVPSRFAGFDRVAMAIVTGPAFDFAAFQARCREKLGVYAPETVLRMEAIPRNENGKVKRQDLKDLAAAHAVAAER